MRWDSLFDDLEGQLEQELGAEEIDLRAEEERLRLGRMSLRDRLTSIVQAQTPARSVTVQLISGVVFTLRPTTFGKDWFAAEIVDDASRATQCVVPIAAVAALLLTAQQVHESLESSADPRSGTRLVDRIGLPFLLRDLCRRRAAVELRTSLGSMHGTIDRVGRDHIDLAVHELDSPRREGNVTHYRVVSLADIHLVLL